MDLRSRGGAAAANDVRDDILLETNFDEDGVLTLAHSTNQPAIRSNLTNNENPLLQRSNFNPRRNFYRSDTSIDRYSEYSLHGRRDPG